MTVMVEVPQTVCTEEALKLAYWTLTSIGITIDRDLKINNEVTFKAYIDEVRETIKELVPELVEELYGPSHWTWPGGLDTKDVCSNGDD